MFYARPVPVFLCPSNPSVEPDGTVSINGVRFGAGCYGENGMIGGSVKPPGPQGQTRLLQIQDGTSNTS